MDNQSDNGFVYSFPSPANGKNNHYQDTAEIEELRKLLLGLDAKQIQQLHQLLRESSTNPEGISRLLPEAIKLRSQQDNTLGEAMVSTVEQAIQLSVDGDVKVLSGAMFPIIVPATRKAVSTALEEMIQSLNQTLEHSLSPQSFRWRWEAQRTGKSFAEIVLLRTLVYRVEQVFLIHRHTGLLLKHLLASEVTAQDPDLVSAMLTAIQDFMRDSFRVDGDAGLQSLQFGELTIWVEASPHAVLAGIIRGNAPWDLREVFQTALSKIHQQFNRSLLEFNGDSEVFMGTEYLLKPCLEARYKKQTSKKNFYALAFLGLIGLLLGVWGFLSWRSHLQWQNFLAQARAEPGIIIYKTSQDWDKYIIEGMRDPASRDPQELLENANINPEKVTSRWQKFISLEPELIARRVAREIDPPSTVKIDIDGQGNIIASGFAPQSWINRTRQIWPRIYGVNSYNDSQVSNLDLNKLKQYQSQVERETLQFVQGSTELLASQQPKLTQIQETIKNLYSAAGQLNYTVKLEITGHTDASGTEEFNQTLSQERAKVIASQLVKNIGIAPETITIKGMGAKQAVENMRSPENASMDRRISFRIFLMKKSQSTQN